MIESGVCLLCGAVLCVCVCVGGGGGGGGTCIQVILINIHVASKFFMVAYIHLLVHSQDNISGDHCFKGPLKYIEA